MKILIANRGEIAIRIMRTCREFGLRSVAVYSEGDKNALHVRYADEAVLIGPTSAAQSYLNGKAILQAARQTGAKAIHPGYGFLSENAEFAQEVEERGLTFIGPTSEVLALTGDKLAARRIAREAGLPVLAGSDVPLNESIPIHMAKHIQYPILIKAVSGGGGRGIRLVKNPQEFSFMLESAQKEALAAFGNATVYLEQLVQPARHIEVQILGDGNGNVICLGERECSIQRRHQKLIEEAPAPGLTEKQRNELYEYAVRLGRLLRYRSLGTVEFLMNEEGHFFFIEVNPRIQVEHTVTEMVTRSDLVEAQLELSVNGNMRFFQHDITLQGWAIEARILAEDAENNFLPAAGTVEYLHEPAGPGIRVDSALFTGMEITTDYDSMISKVIAWGKDRDHAIRRLQRALVEYRLVGILTNIELLQQRLASDKFIKGNAPTTYLDHFKVTPLRQETTVEEEVALAAALVTHFAPQANHKKRQTSHWVATAWREQMRGN